MKPSVTTLLKPSVTTLPAHDDTTIRFAITACSLGPLLVAATAKGVCAILFGDDAKTMTHELQRRFAGVTLIQVTGSSAGTLSELLRQVVALVETPAAHGDFALDIRGGTPFQRRVWRALQSIPAGDTASYTDIARRIGEPRAVRAVAQACGANPLAVAIPCHRVVRSDGALSGYRWGTDRKRTLLQREGTP